VFRPISHLTLLLSPVIFLRVCGAQSSLALESCHLVMNVIETPIASDPLREIFKPNLTQCGDCESVEVTRISGKTGTIDVSARFAARVETAERLKIQITELPDPKDYDHPTFFLASAVLSQRGAMAISNFRQRFRNDRVLVRLIAPYGEIVQMESTANRIDVAISNSYQDMHAFVGRVAELCSIPISWSLMKQGSS